MKVLLLVLACAACTPASVVMTHMFEQAKANPGNELCFELVKPTSVRGYYCLRAAEKPR